MNALCTSPDEFTSLLLAVAETQAQRQCLHWIDHLLRDFSHPERLHFWRTPRGSLHGSTPLKALQEGRLRQLEEAAEAFAEA